MTSATLMREARLRAGLTQAELAERSGRDRAAIARWERGGVAPSMETLIGLLRGCGFDLPLVLVPYATGEDERLRKNVMLSPERRLKRMLIGAERKRVAEQPRFDPISMLQALDRQRVNYIVIGALARLIQGAEEVIDGLDISPSMRPENLQRLQQAVRDLDATTPDGRQPALTDETRLVELATGWGELKLVPEPTGTNGYDDLRRAANREPLGSGVRPSVSSLGDLGRMLAASGGEYDLARLHSVRRLAELDQGRGLRP